MEGLNSEAAGSYPASLLASAASGAAAAGWEVALRRDSSPDAPLLSPSARGAALGTSSPCRSFGLRQRALHDLWIFYKIIFSMRH